MPQPAEVLAEMVRLARPGGWVAGLEPDTEVAICYPPHPAFDRLCEIFTVAFSRNSADQQELDELDATARNHFENSDVIVMPGLYFLARGRKSASV
ncbi:MAG: hypothetical protein ACLPTJ_07895 [Solirubrobacteraceae bacterium]